MANNFFDDSSCVMWLRFERYSKFTRCEINGDSYLSLQTGNPFATYRDVKEGYGALHTPDDDTEFRKDANDLRDDFPGQASPNGTQDFIMGVWVYMDSVGNPPGYQTFMEKLAFGGTNQSPFFLQYSGDNLKWRVKIRNAGDSGHLLKYGTGAAPSAGRWYHVGFWHSTALEKAGLRIYDSETQSVQDSVFTWAGGMKRQTAGSDYLSIANNLDGRMDEFVVFNAVPETLEEIKTKIDDVRKGTYPGNLWEKWNTFNHFSQGTFTKISPCRGASWSTAPSVNVARRYIAGAGKQTSALTTGGQDVGSNLDSTEEYNGSAWSSGGDLNTARRHVNGGGASSSDALSFGGYTTTRVSTTEQYNGTAWTNKNSMNRVRYGHGKAGNTSDAMLALGGNGPSGITAWSEEWDDTSWSSIADLLETNYYVNGFGTPLAATETGGIGGGATTSASSDYNGTTWCASGDLNISRYAHACCGVQSSGLCFGGYNGLYITVTEEYDGVTWIDTQGDLSVGRNYGSPAGNSSGALSVAGNIPSESPSATCEEYNLDGSSANQLRLSGTWATSASLNQPRGLAYSAGTPSSAVVFGGYAWTGLLHLDSTEEYDSTSWCSGGDLSVAKYSIAGVGESADSALCPGGTDAGGRTATCEQYDGSAWSSVADLNAIKGNHTSAGRGVSAALAITGYETAANTASCEEYDGTSWCSSASVNIARRNLGGFGTVNSATCFGGWTDAVTQATEDYDGTSWSSGSDLNILNNGVSGCGNQSAGLAVGSWNGDTLIAFGDTEEYNGTTWIDVASTTPQARGYRTTSGNYKSALVIGGYYKPSGTNTEVADCAEYSEASSGTWLSEGRDSGHTDFDGEGYEWKRLFWDDTGEGSLKARVRTCDNSNMYDFKGWATVAECNLAVDYLQGGSGFGSQSAGMKTGGDKGANYETEVTEEYNGTSWCSGGALNEKRDRHAGAGTATAGMIWCGSLGRDGGNKNSTEEYNGVCWSSGGNMLIACLPGTGFGTQTAALQASDGSYDVDCYSYNGTSWSAEAADLNIGRSGCGGQGTTTDGLVEGRYHGTGIDSESTEEYDGTSWCSGGDLNYARYDTAGTGVSSSSALVCGGGGATNPKNRTEQYDGTSWTNTNWMSLSKQRHGACGTSSATLAWCGYNAGTVAEAEAYTEDLPTWYPTGGSGYYESSGQAIGAPAKRYYQIEMTLTSGSSPQVPEIQQEFGYGAGIETEDITADGRVQPIIGASAHPYLQNNFAEDEDLILHLRCNVGAETDCEINGPDYMTDVNNVGSDDTDWMEIGGSLVINTTDNSRLEKVNSGLPADFPGKGTQVLLTCAWVKFDSLNEDSQTLFKNKSGGAYLGWSLGFRESADDFRFRLRDSGDGSYVDVLANLATVETGKWYHMAGWHSPSLNLIGIRVYDKEGNTVYSDTTNHSGGMWLETGTSSGLKFSVGRDGRHTGHVDEVLVFKGIPATEVEINAKIDEIREQTYGPIVHEETINANANIEVTQWIPANGRIQPSLSANANIVSSIPANANIKVFDKVWSSEADFDTGTYDNVEVVQDADGDSLALMGLVWSTGGNLSTARRLNAGAGTQTSGLTFGGGNLGGDRIKSTEEYNGTAWSAGGDLLYAVYQHDGAGTINTTIKVGGARLGGQAYTPRTEEYNGSTWTSGGDLNVGKRNNGATGNSGAALSFCGYRYVGSDQYYKTSESYNGTAWSVESELSEEKHIVCGAGSQTATLCIGGYYPSAGLDTTEEFDGTSWSTVGSILSSNYGSVAGGNPSSAWTATGYSWWNDTELFDGTSWSASVNCNLSKRNAGGADDVGSGFVTGGEPSVTNTTEEQSIPSSGTWTVDFDTGYDNADWHNAGWINIDGGSVKLRAKTAYSQSALDGATWSGYITDDYSEIDVLDDRWIRLELTLEQASFPKVGQLGITYDEMGNPIITGNGRIQPTIGGNANIEIVQWISANARIQPTIGANGQVFPGITGDANIKVFTKVWTTKADFDTGSYDNVEVLQDADGDSLVLSTTGTAWSTGGDLNNARMNLAGTGTLTAGLSIGGYDGSSRQHVEEYDGSAWSNAAGYPITNERMMACGTQSATLCFGGITNNTRTYNYNGTAWSQVANLNSGRWGHGASGTDGAALCHHGNVSASASNITEHFNGTSWSSEADSLQPKYQGADGGTADSAIYAGGRDGYSATGEEYNGTSWSVGGTLSVGRAYSAGCGASNSAAINFAGRLGGDSGQVINEEYDGLSWSTGGSLSTARRECAGAGVQTSALCFGGRFGGTTWLSSTEEYSASTGTWTADFYTGFDNADWKDAGWINLDGGVVKLRAKTAWSQSALDGATWSSYYTDDYTDIDIPDDAWIRVELTFDEASAPKVNQLGVTFDEVGNPTITGNGRIQPTIGAKAEIMVEFATTINANGRIRPVLTGDGRVSPSIGANASVWPSIPANGRIQVAETQTINGDGRIIPTLSGDGRISPVIGAKAEISVAFTQTINANGRIQVQETQALNGDGRIRPIILGDGRIQPVIIANGRIQPIIGAKAEIQVAFAQTIGAKAEIEVEFDKTITANARIRPIIISDGRVAPTIGAKAEISVEFAKTINANGRIRPTISADGLVARQAEETIGGNARIFVFGKVWSTEADFDEGIYDNTAYVDGSLVMSGGGVGVWSTGGDLNTSIESSGACGTQGAGLNFGGYPPTSVTEEYNGGTWSVGGSLNTGRTMLYGCGTQTAALCFGGDSGDKKMTEHYDGTSWSSEADLNSGRQRHGGCGTETAALCFGGEINVTEHYDGTSWSSGGALNISRWYPLGAGTQIAGLSFSGYGSSQIRDETEHYNGTSWSLGGDLIQERMSAAGCGVETAALVFGGWGSGIESSTEEYDGVSWDSGADLIWGRNWLAGCGLQSAALSIGGKNPSQSVITEEYNQPVVVSTWTVDLDSSFEETVWESLGWINIGTGTGGVVKSRVKTASSQGALSGATWSDYNTNKFISLSLLEDRWLRLELTLEEGSSPEIPQAGISYSEKGYPLLTGNGRIRPVITSEARIAPSISGSGHIQPTLGGNGRIQVTETKIIPCNGRISPVLGADGRIQPSIGASGDIYILHTEYLSGNARIRPVITAKAEIQVEFVKTITAKAEIEVEFNKTITANGRIRPVITAKAEIQVAFANTIQADGKVRPVIGASARILSSTIRANASVIQPSNLIDANAKIELPKYIYANARIQGIITARALVIEKIEKTIGCIARILRDNTTRIFISSDVKANLLLYQRYQDLRGLVVDENYYTRDGHVIPRKRGRTVLHTYLFALQSPLHPETIWAVYLNNSYKYHILTDAVGITPFRLMVARGRNRVDVVRKDTDSQVMQINPTTRINVVPFDSNSSMMQEETFVIRNTDGSIVRLSNSEYSFVDAHHVQIANSAWDSTAIYTIYYSVLESGAQEVRTKKYSAWVNALNYLTWFGAYSEELMLVDSSSAETRGNTYIVDATHQALQQNFGEVFVRTSPDPKWSAEGYRELIEELYHSYHRSSITYKGVKDGVGNIVTIPPKIQSYRTYKKWVLGWQFLPNRDLIINTLSGMPDGWLITGGTSDNPSSPSPKFGDSQLEVTATGGEEVIMEANAIHTWKQFVHRRWRLRGWLKKDSGSSIPIFLQISEDGGLTWHVSGQLLLTSTYKRFSFEKTISKYATSLRARFVIGTSSSLPPAGRKIYLNWPSLEEKRDKSLHLGASVYAADPDDSVYWSTVPRDKAKSYHGFRIFCWGINTLTDNEKELVGFTDLNGQDIMNPNTGHPYWIKSAEAILELVTEDDFRLWSGYSMLQTGEKINMEAVLREDLTDA